MAYEESPGEVVGDVYGDINDDLELQVVQNPYYGDELETSHNDTGSQATNRQDMEVITSRQNDYYEM